MREKRVLIVATTAYMIRQFNMSNIELLQGMGYQVEVACNFVEGNPVSRDIIDEFKKHLSSLQVQFHQLSIVKSPSQIVKNGKALNGLIQLMRNDRYAFVHCQTPVGAALARIAAWLTKTPSIYMVHGFHFHKGSSPFIWMMYYPVEKILSYLTDSLIVINREDQKLAERKMRAKRLYYVPGVGMDLEAIERSAAAQPLSRRDIGIPDDAILIFSVGELNKNKNHETVIRALSQLPHDVHYVIAGEGKLKNHLKTCASELGVDDRVHLLGFRRDVQAIYHLADIYCHPSFREGLSVAIMEAMAAGLPVVCADIRGNEDLIRQNEGGHLLKNPSWEDYAHCLKELAASKTRREAFGAYNRETVKQFGLDTVRREMRRVYENLSRDKATGQQGRGVDFD